MASVLEPVFCELNIVSYVQSLCVYVCIPGGMSMGPWLKFACALETEEAQQSYNPCICHQEGLTPSLSCGGEGCAVWICKRERNKGQFIMTFSFLTVHLSLIVIVKVLTVVNEERMRRSLALTEGWYGELSWAPLTKYIGWCHPAMIVLSVRSKGQFFFFCAYIMYRYLLYLFKYYLAWPYVISQPEKCIVMFTGTVPAL